MTATPDAPVQPSPIAQRMVRWSLIVVSVNLLLLAVTPWGAWIAIATGPAGVTLCIIALVQLTGAVKARGLRIILSMGIAASFLALVYGIYGVILSGPLNAYSECRSNAITNSAQRECTAQFEQDYEDFFARLGVTLP